MESLDGDTNGIEFRMIQAIHGNSSFILVLPEEVIQNRRNRFLPYCDLRADCLVRFRKWLEDKSDFNLEDEKQVQ
jgi:hypothetical protein